MTDPAASAQQPAPGWYPDGSGTQRWWNGTEWTEHTALSAASDAAQAERPKLPEGTRVDNGWVWLVSLVHLVSVLPLVFFDVNGLVRNVMFAELSETADTSMFGEIMAGYVSLSLVSWVISIATWAAAIVGAWRDNVFLKAQGVERPFHWAFAFIPYPLVYLIGRHVVLRKVSRTAGWPLWAHIISYALVLIAVTVWVVVLTQSLLTELLQYSGGALVS